LHASGLAIKTVEAHEAHQDIVFHAGWFCPFVQRVWITLEEMGIPYQYKEVNPYEKEAHFLKINPKGLVPALEYQNKALYESLVLLEFLSDLEPKSALRPADAYEGGLVRLACQEVSSAIVPGFYGLLQAQSDEDREKAREKLYAAFDGFYERWFTPEGPWIRGKEFGLVDAALAPFFVRFFLIEKYRDFKTERLPGRFGEWKKAILERKSVKETTSETPAYEVSYARYLKDEAQSEVAKATRAGGKLP